MTENQAIEASTRKINAYFRSIDESHKWPICNRFNVTERAIKRLQKTGQFRGGFSYFLALDQEISWIVNNEV